MTLFPTQPNIPSPTTAARPVTVPAPGVSAPLGADDAKRARILADAIRARFAQTLVGQDNLRESLIVTLVAGGHILIESVPGLAKTTAAQTLATCVSGSFKRVQCTPDLMPSDLVGTQVFDFASQKFTTQIGPIHANFVLLDEINRSNAKTQSAMLEAMAEGATTIGGQRIALPKPFMVIATENPIEEEGTFNLPEAQMDRFMMKAVMTYPSPDEEARKLAAGGVRELIVIAQDTTYYGLDLYGKRRLAELLEALCRIDGIRWIRLHYAYPTAFPDEVIEVMAREPKICKYLDIPFQHISDDQLAAMHRRHTKAQAYELIDKLRQAIPDLALRTTLLVGYPGETEADFEELLEFVRTVRFERLGVFPYSEEEGTYSARNLPDDVPEEVKQSRVERVMALQNEISLENNRARIGQLERVIIDSRQGDFYVGRSQYDSPEVDQEILIPAAGRRLIRGCFYQVRITAAEDYDLYGELETK